MSHCSLYFPGLLGPDVPLEQLAREEWPGCAQLAHLCKFFSHSRKQALPKCSLEARILQGMGIIFPLQQDVPLAYYRARHVAQSIEPSSLWCLDPVYVQIDQEEAVLLANEQIELSEHEARHIIDDLNAHFAQDGLIVHYVSPHQWLLQGELVLTTRTLNESMQHNINAHQPSGPDETRWRKLINEIQMLLHSHSVNQAREQRGEVTANSLWLWGGVRAHDSPHYEAIISTVYCDERFVRDVALVCDIKCQALPAHVDEQLLNHTTSLLIFTNQLVAIRNKDVFAWLDALKIFDQQILAPLFAFLKQGRLKSLTLYSDTLSMTLTNKDLAKWWKRGNTVDKSILQLRQHYGH